MASIRQIQEKLLARGYDPGPIDGIWGRLTLAAVRAFQGSAGLVADGIVGPHTLERLFEGSPALATSSASPVWYHEAVRLMDVREKPGAADNPEILAWARGRRIAYAHDSIPWCGLFVAHCIGATLPDEPLPGNPLGARAWLAFGDFCPVALGAVLVFWREQRAGWKGHVGFYAGEDDAAYHVLGGNQGDKVCITRIFKGRLLADGVRKPKSVQQLAGSAVQRAASGGYSLREA
jgi:uncharacterized protein (TIGR02594 family)